MSTKRSSSYTNAEDTHLCHIYLDVSQNPIIGIYQSKDMFWRRVENDYNNSRPSFITEVRNKRSLLCRMQTIPTSMGKMRGCIRQIERLKPSGASEADIMNQAKILLSQDNKYKHGFRFDHVWPILKDMEKFTDNETETQSPFQPETERQELFLEFSNKNAMQRERLNDILERKMEYRELKILMIDLNTITDPKKREFMNQQQLKIEAKRVEQQDKRSQNASGSFGDFFENLQGPGNGLPDY
ncbi:hypothetical protein Ddye_001526 [Dipteronia dyeriana]|uniref:No apical meristem-associated C-terminal domain-containing protein n=1 Tax=Dipteronia dyeriana TaxID=168575 RepID=A0AAE0CTJ8_9ROSI|nr:hypothetical protein Ddye_001526 [Dipteronia dyeriana]